MQKERNESIAKNEHQPKKKGERKRARTKSENVLIFNSPHTLHSCSSRSLLASNAYTNYIK